MLPFQMMESLKSFSCVSCYEIVYIEVIVDRGIGYFFLLWSNSQLWGASLVRGDDPADEEAVCVVSTPLVEVNEHDKKSYLHLVE